jgi:hypothetical protein
MAKVYQKRLKKNTQRSSAEPANFDKKNPYQFLKKHGKSIAE